MLKELDVFNFDRLIPEYNEIIQKFKIVPGSVIKTKTYFVLLTLNPKDSGVFESGTLFTVVDIVSNDGVISLVCLQDNRIIEIDCYSLYFNSTDLQANNASLEEMFLSYFEKIL